MWYHIRLNAMRKILSIKILWKIKIITQYKYINTSIVAESKETDKVFNYIWQKKCYYSIISKEKCIILSLWNITSDWFCAFFVYIALST